MFYPDLAALIDQAIDSRSADLWTALPALVSGFDAASSTCTVTPFPSIYQDGEAVPLPALSGIPVAYPTGAGGSITWPLQAGDVVLVIFASASLAQYRTTGNTGDPQDTRRNDLSDAWAIPLAGGSAPASDTLNTTVAQADLLGAKVVVGATRAFVPVVPVPLVPGPVLAPGFMQPAGRAARTGDTVKIKIQAPEVAALIAAFAAVAAGTPVTPIEISGVIVSGSDFVEVK